MIFFLEFFKIRKHFFLLSGYGSQKILTLNPLPLSRVPYIYPPQADTRVAREARCRGMRISSMRSAEISMVIERLREIICVIFFFFWRGICVKIGRAQKPSSHEVASYGRRHDPTMVRLGSYQAKLEPTIKKISLFPLKKLKTIIAHDISK